MAPIGKRDVNTAMAPTTLTRRLVLTNEGARHPLRRALPPVRLQRPRRDDDHDLRLFALSFTAFFICFYSFIF